MKRMLLLIFCILPILLPARPSEKGMLIDAKPVYLSGIEYNISLTLPQPGDSSALLLIRKNESIFRQFKISQLKPASEKGSFIVPLKFNSGGSYSFEYDPSVKPETIRVIPGWLSILPPMAAILLALISRQVLIALFAGIWLGSTLIFNFNPFSGLLNALSVYISQAPADSERIAIIVFSLTLGGMVGVISKSGGTQGIVQKLARFASTPRRGQFATWLMGILVFFDDYANTLIVGNTMRPLTDKLKISREKLAYLVDSTAAPVANIAIISTWIGYELSLINESFQALGLNENAYVVFFRTIPYNFYPLFALVFGLIIALSGRDLFAMHKAEQRSADKKGVLREGAVPLADINSSDLAAKKDAPLRWYNAMLPVAVVILSTLAGLWYTGLSKTDLSVESLAAMGTVRYVSTVFGNSDSFSVLMWAAFAGSFTAIILALAQRILNLNEAILAWVSGVKAMMMATLILTLAWAIGNICTDIQTADYVISRTSGLLSAHLLPLFAFLIAGLIAFATGTSWGTMAILMPIIIPLAYQLPIMDPSISAAAANKIFLSSIASILAGATFGDHCSPISDTTIMSSMACGADHIDHVRTQLPYALMVAGISIVFGYLPVGFGFYSGLSLLLGCLFIFLLIRFAAKKVVDTDR